MRFSKITVITSLIFSISLPLPLRADNPAKFNKYQNVTGFINITEVGGGLGMGPTLPDYSKYFAGITTMNGYVISHHFLTGIGVGAYAYDAGILLPVYLDIRYTIPGRKYQPFVFGDGGILLDISNAEDFGLFLNPGMGVVRKVTRSLSISLSAGIFIQAIEERSSFANMKLGVYFHGNSKNECIVAGRGRARRKPR